jgi:hypothetical protein
MRIDSNSPLLTPAERAELKRIAERLRQQWGRQLPPEYRQAVDEAFGACDGDLEARGPKK